MNNKKISVIIIGNNNIEKCINNITNQSYKKDIEIIILYEPNQEDKIKNMKIKFPTIKIIVINNKNIFKSIYKNKEIITGDYVSILNCEDNVSIDYYRTMVSRSIKENADMVISNCILQYKDGGKAYLNLSEASLKNLEQEKILKEYLKQSGISFLWSIYGNKIFSRELLDKTLKDIIKVDGKVQNFYFFVVMFCYTNKLVKINNEVLFYNLEEETDEVVRDFTKNNEIQNNELFKNAEDNFQYIKEFLKEKNIKQDVNDWQELYLNKDTKQKKDIITKTKTAWNDNLEKIKKEIISEKTKVVSFDIFDTLIMRPFWNPIDLFMLLNNDFRKINNIETGINFSKIRIETEKRVRENLIKNNENKQDITLDEIYQEIEREIDIDKDSIKKIKDKEIELELRFCYERETAKEIYELSKYLHKKVICVSDMYLPISVIKSILNKNGYDIDKIYLSSDIGLTKYKGDLYQYVINDLKIDSNKIIHIGDNNHSDYENALKYGINAQFLPKAIDVFCNENITNDLGSLFKKNLPMWENTSNGLSFLGIRCMLAVVANSYFDNPYRTFNNETDFNTDPNLIGYYALGMHLFGVAKWLIEETTKKKYDKIVFFARDGYWIMKAYQMIKKLYKEAPDEEYLYISRRALIPATLNNKFDFYKLSELIDIYKYTPKTILKYIKNILYNLENLETECYKIGIDINKKFENLNEFNMYMNLIFDKFYDKKKHEQIKENLKEYFLRIFSGNSCVFDIGYSAKPEMYLSKLCKKKIDTFFINISNEEAQEHAKIGKFDLHTYFDYRPAITGVVRESLISTSDPSCIGYDLDKNNQVIPLFEEENNSYQNRFIFDAMQNKAMEFISNIINIFDEYMGELYYQKYYISLPHEMYINSSKELDQEIFYGINFEDSVGLGKDISAIKEWNSEINDKNQKRTTELFDINLVKELKNKIESLEEELREKKEEENEIKKKLKSKEEEVNNIYNSKRWQCMGKIDRILGRKNR